MNVIKNYYTFDDDSIGCLADAVRKKMSHRVAEKKFGVQKSLIQRKGTTTTTATVWLTTSV